MEIVMHWINEFLCLLFLRKKQKFEFGPLVVVEYSWAWNDFTLSENNIPDEVKKLRKLDVCSDEELDELIEYFTAAVAKMESERKNGRTS